MNKSHIYWLCHVPFIIIFISLFHPSNTSNHICHLHVVLLILINHVLIKHVDWCAVWRSFPELHFPDESFNANETLMMVSRKHFSRSHPLPLDSSFTPYPSTSSSVMLLLVSQNNLVSHLCISYPAAVLCIYSCPCCIFAQHSVQYIYYTYPVNYILLFSRRRPLKLNLFTTHLPSFAAVPLFITVPWTLTWNEMK